MKIQREIISRHIDDHKWLNGIADKNEGIADFVKKYAWVIRETFCSYMCENKDTCQLWKKVNGQN